MISGVVPIAARGLPLRPAPPPADRDARPPRTAARPHRADRRTDRQLGEARGQDAARRQEEVRPDSNGAKPRRRASDASGVARPEPTLRIVETRILRGPNYWAREPVVRMLVDLGVLEQFPSNTIPNFTDTLIELMPTLEDHACSLGRRGGFVTRLRDGTWMGRRRAHRARVPEPCRDRRPPRQDAFRGADRLLQLHLRVPRGAGRDPRRDHGGRARQLPRRPTDPAHLFDFAVEIEELISLAERRVRAVDAGAHRRGGEPRHPVHPARPPFAGPVRPRRPPAADPRDDDLADVGDRGRTSRRTRASRTACSTQPACRSEGGGGGGRGGGGGAASRVGYPCVVKPLDGNHGRGVHLDLRNADAVRAAFPEALKQSRSGTSSSSRTSPATTTAAS